MVHKENAAVPAPLTELGGIAVLVGFDRRFGELEMELNRAELFFGADIPGTRFSGENAVADLPRTPLPCIEVRSVEKDNRIGRRRSQNGFGSDLRRFLPVDSRTEMPPFKILGQYRGRYQVDRGE